MPEAAGLGRAGPRCGTGRAGARLTEGGGVQTSKWGELAKKVHQERRVPAAAAGRARAQMQAARAPGAAGSVWAGARLRATAVPPARSSSRALRLAAACHSSRALLLHAHEVGDRDAALLRHHLEGAHGLDALQRGARVVQRVGGAQLRVRGGIRGREREQAGERCMVPDAGGVTSPSASRATPTKRPPSSPQHQHPPACRTRS